MFVRSLFKLQTSLGDFFSLIITYGENNMIKEFIMSIEQRYKMCGMNLYLITEKNSQFYLTKTNRIPV